MEVEVVISLINKTVILMVDKIEFLSFDNNILAINSPLLRVARYFSCGLVLGTNVPMIIFTMRQESKTFLDWLIVFHCVLCLGNLHVVIFAISFSDYWGGFCMFHSFVAFFVHLCKRLLTLGIAIYRFTLVLRSSLVRTSAQRKVFEKIIFLSILLTSVLLTACAVHYRENYKYYLGKITFEPAPDKPGVHHFLT